MLHPSRAEELESDFILQNRFYTMSLDYGYHSPSVS